MYFNLEECLKTNTIKTISEKLNVCIGTVKRWIELKNVPIQYTFELMKILSKEINYSEYPSSLKDQFFTSNNTVEKCWKIVKEEIKDFQDYTFIEPSAGTGSFLKILPSGSIGLDIEPRCEGIVKQDYLEWNPLIATKFIVIGNPPFGLRGNLALKFINHSSKFADYVCFILPQNFSSDGKGSPRKRVQGYNLIYNTELLNTFYSTPENQEVKVNGVFQIWSKHISNLKHATTAVSVVSNSIKIFSLSDGGTVATTRNKKMLDKCHLYLPSTCFGKDNMKIYKSFEELPSKKGYGILFLSNIENYISKGKSIDWSSFSFLSTNSAYNLRSSIILKQFE